MLKLLRYNQKPIKILAKNIISVNGKMGSLIEVEYIRTIDNQIVLETGYSLVRE